MEISQGARLVLEKLNSKGFDAYLVGGCVRDHIMNRPCQDFDVTTNARPEQMLEIFADMRLVLNGMKHGTVTVLAPEPIEVTTYRIDGSSSDARHPDRGSFTSDLLQDLARRDLTVNAIAYGKEGYVDPFDGIKDIKNKIIRTVGEPEARFGEDALRILRAVRFSSQLGFEIESRTAAAIKGMAHTLSSVSAERKLVELTKLMLGENVYGALINHGEVVRACLPVLSNIFGSRRMELACKAVSNAPQIAEVRFAALLGNAFEQNDDSAEAALGAMRALRADKKCAQGVYMLIKHQGEIPQSSADVKYLLNGLGEQDTKRLFELMLARAKASGDESLQRLLLEGVKECDRIISQGECYCIRMLAVSGEHIKQMGKRGDEIGNALQCVLDAVITGKVKNEKEDINKYLNGVRNGDE